jgi:hypothetical protein
LHDGQLDKVVRVRQRGMRPLLDGDATA